MAQIDDLLEQAEAQDGSSSWVLITKYQRKEFYVDSDRAVNVVGRKIEAIREEVSVQGENHSQYIEFVMDRYYDGIDIAEQTLAIHYEVGDVSDEDAPINVYKNDTQIKFGWVVENNLTQYATTVEFCIWARGTLADGNTYILKTLPQKYEIQRGLTIAGGIIEPSTNWYTQFALNMDQKVAQATESADRAVQAASSVEGVTETVTSARDEVVQKASTVNTQHSEVESWHQEVEQFRNEAEQFRNQAEAITGIGLAEEGKPGLVQPDGVTTKVDENGKLIVIGGGSGGGGTTDYQALENKPSIAGIELSGDKSYDDLGLVSKDAVERNFETVNQNFQTLGEFTQELDEDISALDIELEATSTQLESTTDKVDNLTERTESGFKVEVVGKDIHLTDAVDGKVVDFAIYGKSEQNTTNGKNLLDLTKTSSTLNGITFTPNADGTFNASGTATSDTTFHLANNFEDLKELMANGGTFVMSLKNTTYNQFTCNISCNLKNASGTTFFIGADKIPKNILNTDTLEGVKFWIPNGTTVNLQNVGVQIEKNTVDTEYEPYTGGIPSPNPDYPQEIETAGASGSIEVTSTNEDASKSTTSIIYTPNGLSGIKVSSGGNYTDENGQQWITDEIIRYADGSGEYIQRIGKAVFDGSEDESWNCNNQYFYSDLISSINANERNNFMCNRFSVVDINTSIMVRDNTIGLRTNFVAINYSEITNLSDFKTWLTSNNVIVCYELATPIIISLTAEQLSEIDKLNTFKPITNISNNEQCGMKITYATLQEALMLQEAYNQSRDSAQEIVDIKKELSDTTFKVETIIEKADLGIKETASGEEIHLTDSAEGKAVEFALYGKAEQNTTSGKNLLENKAVSKTINGVTFTVNKDKSVTINGTSTAQVTLRLKVFGTEEIGKLNGYKLSGGTSNCKLYIESNTTFQIYGQSAGNESVINVTTEENATAFCRIAGDKTVNETFYPMISLEGGEYEPYTNGASPNPDYPQEIEVSGESYNLLENTATSQTINGVEFVVNEDKSISISGTATAVTSIDINTVKLPIGNYKFSSNGENTSDKIVCFVQGVNGTTDWVFEDERDLTLTQESDIRCRIYVWSGATVNTTYYPMIRKASVKNDRYMPYGKGSVEVKSMGSQLLENTASTMDRLGITFTVNDDGSVTASGTATDRTAITVKDKVYLKKVGAYKLSGCPNGGSETTYRLLFGIKKADGTFIADIIDYGNGASFSITQEMIDSKVYGVALLYVFSGYTANNLTFKPMIRLASDTDLTYEPYKETVSTIPTENGLAGIKVSSNGNYTDQNGQQWICDEIVKYADGSGEYIQRIGKVVFDGSEDWLDRTNDYADKTNGQVRFAKSIDVYYKTSYDTAVMSNIGFARMVDSVSLYTQNGISLYVNKSASGTKVCYITMSNAEVTDLATFKKWLSNNNVFVWCELETPIHTPLTAEEIAEIEKLCTFYPVTNISNDFDCGMKVMYKCDGKNYIDKKLAEMVAAMLNA